MANLGSSGGSNVATVALSLGSTLIKSVFSQLAQHSLRLHDAQAENSAVPQAVTALQQDFADIAQALASGQASPQDAIEQLIHIEGSIEAFLKSLVGKPGTAWNGAPSGCPGSDVPKTENGVHNCDKTCTAGCCIFYNYLEPAIDCFIKRLQKTPPGGSFAVSIPAIAGNKYGFPNFPAYTINVRVAKSNSIAGQIENSTGFISRLLGGTSADPATSPGGMVQSATRFPLYLFGILLAVVIFLIADNS